MKLKCVYVNHDIPGMGFLVTKGNVYDSRKRKSLIGSRDITSDVGNDITAVPVGNWFILPLPGNIEAARFLPVSNVKLAKREVRVRISGDIDNRRVRRHARNMLKRRFTDPVWFNSNAYGVKMYKDWARNFK